MHIEQIQFDDIRYNPERGAFEARVKVQEDGRIYGYPAHVCAPLHADFTLVARGLSEAARRAHQAATPGLRSTRRQIEKQPTVPVPPVEAPSLMQRLFGQAAA